MDMQLAEQLKNKIEEVTEDIDIEIDLLPPSLPSITLPSSSYSFLIHQSISFTIDMNGVMNCHITPSLPQGLILNRTTCTISGTLTSLSFSSYNITAISHSNPFIRIVSIEIISSLISYPQTNLIIGQGLSFSITPNLTKVSTISIVSGSLPIGLSINPSTGVISGSPSQLLSSQSVTIEAMSGTAIQTVVLSFTVITPISSFSYSQSSYVLSRDDPVSIIPTVNGDQLSFSVSSGSLPIGLSLNSTTGMISGIPTQSVTIKAFNEVSDQSFSLSFTIQLIPSSLNYNQTIFIIQNNTYFIIKPTCEGDDLSFSIISGSLPIGLSFHSSTGIISGTPLSSIPLTNITIQASNQVGSTQFTISILVIIPLSNLHYSQFSFTLIKGQSFSISPIISGDNPLFTITSGTLPPGLSLNQSTGIISGIPSSTFPSTSITIQASNQLGFIQTQLSFTVNALSTLTIILISLSILIILIILIIIILIILSKKKKHTLPKKSIEEVKSVENRIPNPSHSV